MERKEKIGELMGHLLMFDKEVDIEEKDIFFERAISLLDDVMKNYENNFIDDFTKEELDTIIVDTKHIMKCVDLDRAEILKRVSILLKIKIHNSKK